MLDAARGASAARITAVIPHYAYARSDKKDAPRISIAARLVADLLVAAGASRVLTMTLHSPQVHGFFGVPVDHMNALEVLAGHFRRRRLEERRGGVTGPGQRQGGLAFRAHSRAADGRREQAASERRTRGDRHLVGDVEGKNVIVLDDEIANGGTILEVLNKLRERPVKRIAVACTHGLFTGKAIEWLSAQPDIAEIFTTDTVPVPPEKRLPQHEDSVDCAAAR